MKYHLDNVCKNLFPKFDIDSKGNSLSLIAKKNNYCFDDKELNKILSISKKINQDIRLCLHNKFSDNLQSMVIVNRKASILEPHFHKKMDEVLSIFYGKAIFFIFNKNGTINEKIVLKAGNHNLKFVKSNQTHLLLPLSNFVVFHETHRGPFNHLNRNFYVPRWFSKKNLKNKVIFLNKLRSVN
jgi:cupin fold WbuC family metalloprotein